MGFGYGEQRSGFETTIGNEGVPQHPYATAHGLGVTVKSISAWFLDVRYERESITE